MEINWTSWKDIKAPLGLIASVLLGLGAVWGLSLTILMTKAEAADEHSFMADVQVEQIRREINRVQLERMKVEFSNEYSPVEKHSLLQQYDTVLKQLMATERVLCRKAGRPDCA